MNVRVINSKSNEQKLAELVVSKGSETTITTAMETARMQGYSIKQLFVWVYKLTLPTKRNQWL